MPHFRRFLLALTTVLAGSFLAPTPASAQMGSAWQWASAGGSIAPDEGTAIAVDAAGNTYVTGFCRDSAQFGVLALPGRGGDDIFVAKYDPIGALLWLRGGGSASLDQSRGIAVDPLGNCYVSGIVGGPATFDNLPLPGTGFQAFVVSYDPAGTVRWVRGGGGAGFGLSLDAGGNVYAVGAFTGQTTFGAITLTSTSLDNDNFVVSYDPSGNVRWARQFGGVGDEAATLIGVSPAGDYCVAGGFRQTTTIGGITLTGVGLKDGFVAKFNAAGVAQWAAVFGGAGGYTEPGGLAVGQGGECYVVGNSDAPISQLGPFQQQNPAAGQGGIGGFVACYSASGVPRWLRGVISPIAAAAVGVARHGAELYVTGGFKGTTTFESASNSLTLSAVGAVDLFVTRYDTAIGQLITVIRAGGTQAAVDLAVGQAIAVDAAGASHLTGIFGADMAIGTLQPGSLPVLTSRGNFDVFVATLSAGPMATPHPLTEAAFRIFPNPAKPAACLTIEGLALAAPVRLTLLDALGRAVQTFTTTPAANGTGTWTPAAAPAGIYSLRAEQNGVARTRRVVIE